jgi:hypothetical protein
MSIEHKLEDFVSIIGPCPPIPKRELLHRNPEAYLCEALAVIEWELEKSHELAVYLSPIYTPDTVSGHIPESATPQLKPSVQETGT